MSKNQPVRSMSVASFSTTSRGLFVETPWLVDRHRRYWAAFAMTTVLVLAGAALCLLVDPVPDDVKRLEELSPRAGVGATIECSEATRPTDVELLHSLGRRAGDKVSDKLNALVLPPHHGQPGSWDPSCGNSMIVEQVGQADVGVWQQAAAEGWGHTTTSDTTSDPVSDRRRASDAFALAAYHSDRPGLLLARHADDETSGWSSLSSPTAHISHQPGCRALVITRRWPTSSNCRPRKLMGVIGPRY